MQSWGRSPARWGSPSLGVSQPWLGKAPVTLGWCQPCCEQAVGLERGGGPIPPPLLSFYGFVLVWGGGFIYLESEQTLCCRTRNCAVLYALGGELHLLKYRIHCSGPAGRRLVHVGLQGFSF